MRVVEEFVDEYIENKLEDYIHHVGHWFWVMAEAFRLSERKFFGSEARERVELLKKGTDENERCIVVYLRKDLPDNISLPQTYKGIRVVVNKA